MRTDTQTTRRILDRGEGRRWAEEILTAIQQESEEYREGFWRAVKKQLPIIDIAKSAMSDDNAREFGSQRVPFGKHNGKSYDEMPLDYLEWLTERNDELRRYYLSRRVQAEIEEGE